MKKTSGLFLISLTLLTIIALFVRVYKLAELPPGLTWDEAAIGYNAYSILTTARDEHGAFLPLIFKSFGDYKPGLYIYLTVPVVWLMGLTETAVRLPSAIAGALTVFALGLLVYELFSSRLAGLFSALVLAFMPWHLHFSRGAWEVNVFVFFLTLGLYFLIRNLKEKRSLLVPTLLFLVCLYLYQAAKIMVPLIVIITLICLFPLKRDWFKEMIAREKHLWPLYAIIAAVLIYFVSQTTLGPAGNRLLRLNLFSYRPDLDPGMILTDGSETIARIFHSLPDIWARMIASRYLNHFSSELLFSGRFQTLRETLPKMGLLHLFDAVLLMAGLIQIVRNKNRRAAIFLLSLLLLAPLPGSLTLTEYSSVRSLFMVIPLAAISGLGLLFIFNHHRLIFLGASAIYLYSLVLDTDLYFNHNGRLLGEGGNAGHKQAVALIRQLNPKKVIFTDVYGQPYIYYLFYTAYDPASYQAKNNFISGGVDVGRVPSLDNIEFHQFSVDDINTGRDTLFIGTIGNIPDTFNGTTENITYFDQINYPSGHPIFRVVKTN